MMKLLKVFLCMTVVFLWMHRAAVAAGGRTSGAREINIVTSFYPMHIMALNVVRDIPGVSVANLAMPATGCLHDYTLTVNDMKKLSRADVLVANGAGMEPFLERIARQYPSIRILRLTDAVVLARNHDNSGYDPHTWMTFEYHKKEIAFLMKELSLLDPAHAAAYEANAASYINRLEALRLDFEATLAPYRGAGIVTFHEAFSYFSREFGLRVAAVVEEEPGNMPTAMELARTIDLVKDSKVFILFIEHQYPADAAATIARATGARLFMLDPAVNGDNVPEAFINAMRKNLEVLKHAFSG